jgi:U3 small nucleolar RNA-associated protein 25
MWSLNNWSKYYRQTLLFGALQDAQINSVFNKYCLNLQGQVGSSLFPLGLLEALIAV